MDIPAGARLLPDEEIAAYRKRTGKKFCPNTLFLSETAAWKPNTSARQTFADDTAVARQGFKLPIAGRTDWGCYVNEWEQFITWMSEKEFEEYGHMFIDPEELEYMRSPKKPLFLN